MFVDGELERFWLEMTKQLDDAYATIKDLIKEVTSLRGQVRELKQALSGRTVSCQRCNDSLEWHVTYPVIVAKKPKKKNHVKKTKKK